MVHSLQLLLLFWQSHAYQQSGTYPQLDAAQSINQQLTELALEGGGGAQPGEI